MHNLFLGTGKQVMDMWLNHPSNLLNGQKLGLIEGAIHNFIILDGIGRLPNKITSHLGDSQQISGEIGSQYIQVYCCGML